MKSSKSSLFLLELIIAILFFSISAAACIQLFAKAHALDIRTSEQNQAIIWSQNLAELWRCSHGDLSFIENQIKSDYMFAEGAVSGNISAAPSSNMSSLHFSFDKNWNFTGNTSAYDIILESENLPGEDGLLNATVRFFRSGEDTSFYELPLVLYITDKEAADYE